jgi:hypothetical protein
MLNTFLHHSGEERLVLLLLAAAPALMVLSSQDSVRPRHGKVCAVMALVFGATAALALSTLRPGMGLGGLPIALAGLGGVALATMFASAAVSIALVLLLRGRARPRATPPSRPSEPLSQEYLRWKADTKRPAANYDEFLREAHPRRFPPSVATLLVCTVLLVVVFAMLFHRR